MEVRISTAWCSFEACQLINEQREAHNEQREAHSHKIGRLLEILQTALDLSPFPPSFWENMYREKVDIYVFYIFDFGQTYEESRSEQIRGAYWR